MIDFKDIKLARKALGKTQIQVAIEVGVSLAAYRLWESGGGQPTNENEVELKKALKLR